MVFLDSRVAVCDLTTALIKLLPTAGASYVDLICDYSAALSIERRKEVLQKFAKGQCRILVFTEAAGMGLDISDIVRVIQWNVPSLLNFSAWWQRAGRGGRSREVQAVAILFYNPDYKIKEAGEWERFSVAFDAPSAVEILREIY
ncbi:hypothetical protein RUND412_009939, partial [Rhizina undulata]